MTGLFDNILNGDFSTVSESTQLSYEEESYIENNITKDPETLADYAAECFIGMNSAYSSITVLEAVAAVEIKSGKDPHVVMESLADRAGDAYDTIKRWATKIWKAIKKFTQKVWNHIKNIKDRVVAFFTSNENVLRDVKGSFKVKWAYTENGIESAANTLNALCALTDYSNLVDKAGLTSEGENIQFGVVVNGLVRLLRQQLFPGSRNGEPDYSRTETWDKVKGEVLRVTKLGYDNIFKDFMNLGEKNYKEAMSLEGERVDDLKDRYDDIELKDNASDAQRERYLGKRNDARVKIMMARAKLQLRQRGIQLLARAISGYVQQCAAAAKQAIRHKNGLSTESYNPSANLNDYQSLMSAVMI